MQSVERLARKRGVQIRDSGDCQFCGAAGAGGYFECLGRAHRVSELVDHRLAHQLETLFLSVDAMALQHSEAHGPWNDYLHLTRLHLMLDRGFQWQYRFTPVLSGVLDEYKAGREPVIQPPEPGRRGALTTRGLLPVRTVDECQVYVREWANAVHATYEKHHQAVLPLADTFLDAVA